MKNLIEISRIVTRKKIRKIEVFDGAILDSKNSKFVEFYDALMSERFKNDRDAATLLYACSPTDDKYRQLKSRFRKRLLNTLFFIDIGQPGAPGYDRAYFSTHKDWTLVKILMANDARFTAEDLAKQILTVAQKFKFADVILNCARILRQFAAEDGNEKEFEEFDSLIKQYSDVMGAEIRSEELFQRVLMAYGKPAWELRGGGEQLQSYCDALVGLSEIYDSPIVFYNMFLVWTYRYELVQDYEAMLEVCGRAEQYIEHHPNFVQEEKLATFQLKKMMAYLHLRDFKNGKTNAEKCLQHFAEGSDTWFRFMEYYLLMAFHTDNFIHAIAIFIRAKSHPRLKKIDADSREKWKIYEVYLNYFLEKQPGQIDDLKQQVTKNFRLGRFLNDPILYPKDQRVLTVHMVIAQVLFLLDKRAFPEAAESIDRLRSYASKQLDKDENFRMIHFIRLLQQLAKVNFKISEILSTEKHYDALVERPFFYRGRLSELELVPYEKLWNHILAKL
ncbi:MAG: hypothetical protein HY842_05730 [Bacteroidetes bacterium]|nr:hypothetical protein [Bacteroidota bacterium]